MGEAYRLMLYHCFCPDVSKKGSTVAESCKSKAGGGFCLVSRAQSLGEVLMSTKSVGDKHDNTVWEDHHWYVACRLVHVSCRPHLYSQKEGRCSKPSCARRTVCFEDFAPPDLPWFASRVKPTSVPKLMDWSGCVRECSSLV